MDVKKFLAGGAAFLLVVGWSSADDGAASGGGGEGAADILIREVTETLLPSGIYNVVTFDAPRAMPVGALGLRNAGVTAGPIFLLSDEIRIFADKNHMDRSPKARLWLNAREGGKLWYHTGGQGSAESHVLERGEVLVVYTRASTKPIAWKNVLREEEP